MLMMTFHICVPTLVAESSHCINDGQGRAANLRSDFGSPLYRAEVCPSEDANTTAASESRSLLISSALRSRGVTQKLDENKAFGGSDLEIHGSTIKFLHRSSPGRMTRSPDLEVFCSP